MDQIFINCARELAERKLREGKYPEALSILEALEAQGEQQKLIPFCREMKALENMALKRWLEDRENRFADVANDYSVLRLLGEGGQSWNYLVRDPEGQWLAMKARKYSRLRLPEADLFGLSQDSPPPFPEGSALEALLSDCLAPFLLEKLRGHPNVIHMKNWLLTDVDGEVCVRIFTEPLLPLRLYKGRDAARLGLDICSALREMHRRNIYHRDVKPGNIYVDRDGRFKLGDFGSAVIVSEGTGSDGRRHSFTAANFDDTIPMSMTAPPFWDVPPTCFDNAEPAELTAYDIRSLGYVMAHLLLRDRCDADSLEARGPVDIMQYREEFEVSELGRIILRAAETTTSSEPDGTSAICKGYTSVEEMRRALQGVVGAPEDVRGDFDRFFNADCRDQLMIQHPKGVTELHDGRMVRDGENVRFILTHYGHEAPSAITMTRRTTPIAGESDADRPLMMRGDLTYGNGETQVLDPNCFRDGSEVEITAEYPDGFEARWKVEMAPEPKPPVFIPPEPPIWDDIDTVWD